MGALIRRLGRARPSRIGRRLLAFNLLLVFLPVAGILYLDVYETRLLEVQERGMVQQARLVAAALGGRDPLTAADAGELLARFGPQGDARIRIYGADGALLADSVRAEPAASGRGVNDPASAYAATAGIRERLLYRLGAWLARARRAAATVSRRMLVPSSSRSNGPGGNTAAANTDHAAAPEVRAALRGRYGADTRPTPGQRSLTLYSAMPIRSGSHVAGAAVVSQSTFRLLQALYDVRLRIFEIVLASVLVAVAIGLVTSATIVRPLVRLRRAAVALADRGATPASFGSVARRDEIGDLARALEELTARLDAHIKLLESFAGDVSHEFKNPLASIRAAAETIAATESAAERRRLFELLTRDVDRLERLVSGVRELARIDAQLAHEAIAPVDVGALVAALAAGFAHRGAAVRLTAPPPSPIFVRAAADRLAQVFENVLENAVSFSPRGDAVDVTVTAGGGAAVVTIADRGPGIPPAHLERVFERFFSYRPADGRARQQHTGLGLAIARAIVEGYGGTIAARVRDGGGAVIEVRLPRTDQNYS
jgi:two-component system sensor histidine kinase ChvG